jgi:hypothetical protein
MFLYLDEFSGGLEYWNILEHPLSWYLEVLKYITMRCEVLKYLDVCMHIGVSWECYDTRMVRTVRSTLSRGMITLGIVLV